MEVTPKLHRESRALLSESRVVSRFEIQAAPNPLALVPCPCAMLHVLAVRHAEAEVRYRVTADIDTDTAAGRLIGSHTEFLDEAAEAASSARRLCDEGYLNVEITDTTMGEWSDEASLERAARAEGH